MTLKSVIFSIYNLCFAGDYSIEITYFGDPIPGSPFIAKASDSKLVQVGTVKPGDYRKGISYQQ